MGTQLLKGQMDVQEQVLQYQFVSCFSDHNTIKIDVCISK